MASFALGALGAFVILLSPLATAFGFGPDDGSLRPLRNPVSTAGQSGLWQTLEPGLDLGEFTAPNGSTVGNSQITAVRVDPRYFKMDLLSVIGLALPDALGIDAWTSRYHLSAAINAGMFEQDRRTTTGYARVGTTTLNPSWKASYQAFLALDPDDPKLPAATYPRLRVRQCQSAGEALSHRAAEHSDGRLQGNEPLGEGTACLEHKAALAVDSEGASSSSSAPVHLGRCTSL